MEADSNQKNKDNNRISLHNWNSYLKKLYESLNGIDNFETLLTTEEVFSLEDIDFGVKRLENGKAKDIERYEEEILKFEGPIFIHYTHKIFNLVVKQSFSKPWT